jgi:hypothetical protein
MDPDPDPQKQPVYPQQYPPQYPQQYPPQHYGPPYYPPYPPPKRDDKKVLTIIIIVIIVIFVLPTVLAAVLYFVVIGLAPSGTMVPTGTWGAKIIVSSTAVNVDFGKVSSEPRPMDIVVILVRNGTAQGVYEFSSNNDGALRLDRDIYVGTLTYADLADNQKINVGDTLKLTDLYPNSDYTIKMIWGPTGDQITSTTFSTPA